MFYTFLHVIATHDLSSVFLSPQSQVYLDPMVQMLLNACCNHNDIFVRKVVVVYICVCFTISYFWGSAFLLYIINSVQLFSISAVQACVQIFIRLIKDWCMPYGEEKVNSFRCTAAREYML